MAAGHYSDEANAANSLAGLTKHVTDYLDEVVAAKARTSDLVANASLVRAGATANTVKIGTVTMDGLGTYSKNNGYPTGSVSLTWQTMELAYDRARQFNLDSVDLATKDDALTAAYTMAEFVRQKVVPEIDEVRLAKCFAGAASASQVTYGYTASAANVIGTIVDAIDTARDGAMNEDNTVVYVDRALKTYIAKSSELTKTADIKSGTKALYTQVDEINGAKIVYCPSAYMKSAWTAYDGVTNGQTAGGLVAASGAKDISIMAVAGGCAQGVVAHNIARIITDPDDIDGVKVNYRIYHDLFVPANKAAGICAISSSAAPSA